MVLGPVATDPELDTEGLTRAQYDALVDAGHFRDEPLELLEGVLVRMSPQGAGHARAVDRIASALMIRLYLAHGGEVYRVRQEKPFAASDLSEPEPDIAIVDGDADRSGHPSSAHLLVEVADTSRRIDLVHKPRIYGGSGVPEYWVVDLQRASVVRHLGPSGDVRRPYLEIEEVPFTRTLSVLGIDVSIADLLR